MLRIFVLLSLWPLALVGQETVRVEVTYRITDTCEATAFRARGADRMFGALAQNMMRQRMRAISQPGTPIKVLDDRLAQGEVEAAIAKYRAEHPDKYYSRVVRVQLMDETSGTLTCFFDESLRLTSTTLDRADGSSEAGIDIGKLPLQRTWLDFESDD